MSAVKLIYFEGCPNSKHARAVLLSSKVGFEVIKQDDLPKDDPYREYSSPTILKNGEILFGEKLGPNTAACSAEKFDEGELKKKLRGKNKLSSKKGLFAFIGSFGSALTVGLCPICIPAIGAFLSSIGLGFLVSESVLLPILFIFLTITIGGLLFSYLKEHGKVSPLILGVLMGISLYMGRYVYLGAFINQVLMYGGIAGIVTVSFWNLRLRKQVACSACSVESKSSEKEI